MCSHNIFQFIYKNICEHRLNKNKLILYIKHFPKKLLHLFTIGRNLFIICIMRVKDNPSHHTYNV